MPIRVNPIKINLACGEEYLDDFMNIDNCSMFPNCKVDLDVDILTWDIGFTWDLNKGSVEYIKLSHFIMYTKPEELRPLLKRWHSWLEKGGKLEIESSDIKKLCEIVANETDVEKVYSHGLINIFGNEKNIPHRWGWSVDSLMFELYQAGFKECLLGRGEKKPERDFKVIAIK